jgi:hypothetical protein
MLAAEQREPLTRCRASFAPYGTTWKPGSIPVQTSKEANGAGLPDGPAPARRIEANQTWLEVEQRFLAAVVPHQRCAVEALVRDRHNGGRGLRNWLRSLVAQGRRLPERLPAELIDVYLADPDALPLHDCAECGLAIPVHAGTRDSEDAEPEFSYFPTCPCCGGITGWCAYWSNTSRGAPA